MTNLLYFGMNHEKHSEIKRWYDTVYQVEEVKAITHEWYQVVKSRIPLFESVEFVKPKL
jgi:hypothetical protein